MRSVLLLVFFIQYCTYYSHAWLQYVQYCTKKTNGSSFVTVKSLTDWLKTFAAALQQMFCTLKCISVKSSKGNSSTGCV